MTLRMHRMTEDEQNFWWFCIPNFQTTPQALRCFFDNVIPPHDLATIINTNMNTVLSLTSRKIINKSQVEVLQRVPGTTWPSSMTHPIGSGIFNVLLPYD